ncbi:6086_t:CDS:1, partial [Scutellospora calospora]
YIDDDEKADESINLFDNNQNFSTGTNLILEDIINLRDPIFQDDNIIPNEISNNNLSNNVEDSINIDFNPENLVNTVLNNELD